MHTRVAVIGAGSWGTALANLLANQGYRVALWARQPQMADLLAQERQNSLYLSDVPLHPHVHPTATLEQAVEQTPVYISAVPSHAVRAVWSRFAPLLPRPTLLVSTTKGIENGSFLTMSQVLRQTVGEDPSISIAVLSGPTFAREVSQGMPSATVLAAGSRDVAIQGQQLLSTPLFRVYTSTDVLGVELGGALKNVMALAAGVCDGLQMGDNARAALITRGLAEMSQLGLAMGARAATFAGLSGMGDLVLTCTGALSRNHSVGMQLGQGKKLPDILAQMRMVAEGVMTTRAALGLGRQYHVEMPIATKVDAILHGHLTPQDAVTELMTRALKHEDREP